MAASNSTTTPPNHLPWLDWCRFLAAFVVVIVHARAFAFASYGSIDADQQHWITAAFYMATRIGTQGVLVFFVLSGFLVGGKAIERFRNGSFSASDYVIDRCVRILVPFIPVLVLTVAVAHFIGLQKADLSAILGNLFFLQGIAVEAYPGNEPLWSLSYEVWFYVLAGSCVVLGMRGKACATSFGLATVSLLVFTLLKPVYLFCWLIGALAWVGRPKLMSWSGLCGGILLLIYGMMGVQVFSEAQTASINAAFSRYSAFFISYAAAQLAFCVGCALLVQQLILLPPSGPRIRCIERLGTPLAAFSYTIYLIHNPILHVFKAMGLQRAERFTPASIGLFLALLLSCLMGAFLFFWIFERNTARCKRLIKQRIQTCRQQE
jgi:peptidoglycan/LPS O-acetylase OafA/YrhL